MVLMRDNSHRPTRVCDARCYNAEVGGECGCICEGRNHAAGLVKALATIRDVFLPQRPQYVTRAARRALERERARQVA